MNPTAADKANLYANIILIIASVILFFLSGETTTDVAMGVLIAAIFRKSVIGLTFTKSNTLIIGLLIALGLVMWYLFSVLAFLGYMIAIIAYLVLRFVFYYLLENN